MTRFTPLARQSIPDFLISYNQWWATECVLAKQVSKQCVNICEILTGAYQEE